MYKNVNKYSVVLSKSKYKNRYSQESIYPSIHPSIQFFQIEIASTLHEEEYLGGPFWSFYVGCAWNTWRHHLCVHQLG